MKTNHALHPYHGRAIAFFALAAMAIALVLPQSRAADQYPPGKMTFQGFLTDTSGGGTPIGNTTPVNQTIQFKIYDALTGGNVLWAEEQVVTVDKGHFSVLLGEGGPVNGLSDKHTNNLSGVFIGASASDRFIGITLQGQSEIAPRIQFFAAPYAQTARNASALVSPAGVPLLEANGATINGQNLVALNAASVTSGTLGDGRLSANVDLLNTAQTFSANKTFGAGAGVSGANVIEFGQGVAGKDANAGKIGYGTFTAGALDIVGVGNNVTRQVKIWAEGGATINGPIYAGGNISSPKFRATAAIPAQFGAWGGRAGSFTSGGGTLVITMNVTGYNNGGFGTVDLYIDGTYYGSTGTYLYNQTHTTFPGRTFVMTFPAGAHSVQIQANNVFANSNNYSEVTVVEYPF